MLPSAFRPWRRPSSAKSGRRTPCARLPNGQTQLFVGLHLIHEVTTPQAFDMLRARGWGVAFPDRTIGTVDHIVPTNDQRRPFVDLMAEEMLSSLERNCRELRHPAARSLQRPAGHRPRDRPGAGADAAGDDDRLRRQPHLHARGFRGDRVRDRHVAGPRRPRLPMPGDGSAEGSPHLCSAAGCSAASTPRT